MNEHNKLYEMISTKLREEKHSKLLEILIYCFQEGGKRSVEARIREILQEIEAE